MSVLTFLIFFLGVPVNKTGNVFLVLILAPLWFLELFHFGPIFDVDAVDPSLLVAHEQLAVAFVMANARNYSRCDVSEDALQTTISSVPNFDTLRMCCDKRVEDRIVKDTNTSFVIGQMIVSWLVVIIEKHSATTSNDSLGRLGNGKAVNFVGWAVESLHCCERTHVPNSEHSRDVCRDDLVGTWHPLYPNKAVVVPF